MTSGATFTVTVGNGGMRFRAVYAMRHTDLLMRALIGCAFEDSPPDFPVELAVRHLGRALRFYEQVFGLASTGAETDSSTLRLLAGDIVTFSA